MLQNNTGNVLKKKDFIGLNLKFSIRHPSNITVVLLRFSLFQQAFVRFARSSHVHLWRGQFQNICTRAF